jgi:chemotaxis protein methyltransferase CheR
MDIKLRNQTKTSLVDNDFYLIRDYIYENCGIFFKLEKKYLIEDKIIARIEKLSLNGINEYIYYLKFHPDRAIESKYFYDLITINETSFFRNEPQLDAFEKEVLPEIVKNNKNNYSKTIKIWSAGCSSGEEPYTLSIILNKVLAAEINSWNLEIVASDISDAILEKARIGAYNNYSLRNTDETIKKKYFDKITVDSYRIKDQHRKIIRFSNINLFDERKVSLLSPFDIILCRNVLIYFDNNSKEKVINKFYELLKPGGYLFLGHSESLHGSSKAFKLILFQGALAYKKE